MSTRTKEDRSKAAAGLARAASGVARTAKPDSGAVARGTAKYPTTHDEVLFDEALLMRRVGADPARLREFAQLFLDLLPRELKALHAAIEGEDSRKTAKAAHGLAGSFATLAMDLLAAQAIEIETTALHGELPLCTQLLDDLESRCADAVAALERFVRRA